MSHRAIPKGQQPNVSTRLRSQSYELVSIDSTTPINPQSHLHESAHLRLTPTWRSLWKPTATMVGLFLSACVFALCHLGFFLYLNKRQINSSGSIPQSYVAAVSHMLGLLFRATLCGSLVVAFTQYLWYLMRQKAIKISSIESLFKVTQNPFLLAQPDVIKVAPLLFILAAFTWLLPVAVTFPPGALIVVSNTVENATSVTVPTYNASSMGDGTTDDATIHSMAIRYLSGGSWIYLGPTFGARRLGRLVLELDSITPTESPCGPNCTFSIEFSGPYLRCAKEIINQTLFPIGTLNCGYNAFTATNVSTLNSNGRYNIGVPFNMTASRSVGAAPGSKYKMLQEIETISCIPSWAHYKVNVTYENGLQTVTRSERHMGSIADLLVPPNPYYPNEGVWSPSLVQYLTGLNYFALIDALITPLSGNYTMLQSGNFFGGSSSALSCGPIGNTIAADTHLNTQKNNVSRSPVDGPKFSLSQNVLNDALFNLTMSASFQLGLWETNVSASIRAVHQFYLFDSPQTLIVPYSLCVALSIPFLLLGLSSLRSNGASAIEGGFVQVLMTTTGSKALQKAAAGGCLGGEENTPEALKNLKVRFGELASDGDYEHDDLRHVRRAGFGTEDEVVPLKPGIPYGRL